MTIRASSTQEITRLLNELEVDEIRREAAVARLIVIGTRAVPRLLGLLDRSADREARIAALRALQAIGDGRAVAPALALVGSSDSGVVEAAISLLEGLAGATSSDASAPALDALTTLALSSTAPRSVRLRSVQALGASAPAAAAPLLDRLRADATLGLDGPSGPTATAAQPDALEALRRAAEDGRLPRNPAQLSIWLAERGDDLPLAALQQLVERLRTQERQETARARRDAWFRLRGAVHERLARRDSRVALYDLRDTFGLAAGPLPPAFVEAVGRIGDEQALEAVAAAFERSVVAEEAEWRRALVAAFRAIAARLGLTRRHAVIRRVLKKYRGMDGEF